MLSVLLSFLSHSYHKKLYFLYMLIACTCCIYLPTTAHANSEQAIIHASEKRWDYAIQLASQSNNKALMSLISWRYLLDNAENANFNDYARFLETHPDWPEKNLLIILAEQKLRDSPVADNTLLRWFNAHPPITGLGKIHYIALAQKKGIESNSGAQRLVKEAWHLGDFTADEEKNIITLYSSMLNAEDHSMRADRLVWEGKYSAARRMFSLISRNQQLILDTRIDLLQHKGSANRKLARLSTAQKRDPGVIFGRIKWRHKINNHAGVREMLRLAPDDIPYPQVWWKYRAYQVRELIGSGKYKEAHQLLDNHGQTEGFALADALWLKGWLELEFLKRPKEAYTRFKAMHKAVNYPVSLARAAYWSGRAAEALGYTDHANGWYKEAAIFPTVFYGQLAVHALGKAPSLPVSTHISSYDLHQYASSPIAKAIKLCLDAKRYDWAKQLIHHTIESGHTEEDTVKAARLPTLWNHEHARVLASKHAMRKHLQLVDMGYPLYNGNTAFPAQDLALIHGIIRQESLFDTKVVSPAGAIGLMQVMPATAKETARKIGMGYSKSRLYEAPYNLVIGSHYLERLLNAYDGSYVKTIAAYNAGPSRVRAWVDANGNPGTELNQTINWIELIPFAETRNYVQRVMENTVVYRGIIQDAEYIKPNLADDLMR